MTLRKLTEAIAVGAAVAVVAMILRSNHFVLRALVIIAIFMVDVALDVIRGPR